MGSNAQRRRVAGGLQGPMAGLFGQTGRERKRLRRRRSVGKGSVRCSINCCSSQRRGMLTCNAGGAIIGKTGDDGARHAECRADDRSKRLLRCVRLRERMDERHKQQQQRQPQAGNPVAAEDAQKSMALFCLHARGLAGTAGSGQGTLCRNAGFAAEINSARKTLQ
jgi:hypothetical protein